MYDPQMVQPFRDELTSIGVKELLTSEDVDAAVAPHLVRVATGDEVRVEGRAWPHRWATWARRAAAP